MRAPRTGRDSKFFRPIEKTGHPIGCPVSVCLVLTEKMQYHLLPARNRMFAGKNSVGFSLLFNKACYRRAICDANQRGTNKKSASIGMSSFYCQVLPFGYFASSVSAINRSKSFIFVSSYEENLYCV